jgi:hypothetical protein
VPSARAQIIQAHIASLQAKLARAKTAPKPPVQLELDPHEMELWAARQANKTPRQTPLH